MFGSKSKKELEFTIERLEGVISTLENNISSLNKLVEEGIVMIGELSRENKKLRKTIDELELKTQSHDSPTTKEMTDQKEDKVTVNVRGKRLPHDFAETFYPYLVRNLNGEISIAQIKKELHISDSTYYRFKKILLPRYESEYKKS